MYLREGASKKVRYLDLLPAAKVPSCEVGYEHLKKSVTNECLM